MKYSCNQNDVLTVKTTNRFDILVDYEVREKNSSNSVFTESKHKQPNRKRVEKETRKWTKEKQCYQTENAYSLTVMEENFKLYNIPQLDGNCEDSVLSELEVEVENTSYAVNCEKKNILEPLP